MFVQASVRNTPGARGNLSTAALQTNPQANRGRQKLNISYPTVCLQAKELREGKKTQV
jgi:hypothetical protein